MFTIRPATLEDADTLAELGRRIFLDTFAKDNTPEDMAGYLAATFGPALQRAELQDASVRFLLVLAHGTPVAYAKLGQRPANARGRRPLQISRFYVERAWHGSGAAPALMEAVLQLARAQGHDDLWLGVWEHNARAIGFYQKQGFVRVGEQPCQVGADVQTDWVMARAVTPEPSR